MRPMELESRPDANARVFLPPLTIAVIEIMQARNIEREERPLESGSINPGEARSPLTVFISYSWDSDTHKEWVHQLALRLSRDGVGIILDRWNLRLGDDRFLFMEEAVADARCVLLFCTPPYAMKANQRSGGVGYEASIITPELAATTHQQKFIPVLRSGVWDDSLPRWLRSRIGANLSDEPYSEREYDLLLRHVHDEAVDLPPVGPRPTFPTSPRNVSGLNSQRFVGLAFERGICHVKGGD
jgi:hypothetical protein